MDTLVSVIVPIFNVDSYLSQCIDSIVNQTYKTLEIILIDDGSTDRSGLICDDYANKDSRIMVFHQSNKGVSVARNLGITKSKGKYIMFVDPDDWLEIDCCQKAVKEIKDRDVEVLYFQRCCEYDHKTEHFFAKKINVLTSEDFRFLQLEILGARDSVYGFVARTPWAKIYLRDTIIAI